MGWCRGHCEVGVWVARGLYIRAIYSTSSLSSLLYIGPPKLSHCRSQNPSQRPPFYGIDNDAYQQNGLLAFVNVKNLLHSKETYL